MIDIKDISRYFNECDDIAILTHANPDGDTLGAAFGLYYALTENGKRVKVLNEKPGTKITISLEDMTVECGSLNFKFDLDPFRRHCMLEGLDAISLTMQHEKEISDYEKAMPSWRAKGTF